MLWVQIICVCLVLSEAAFCGEQIPAGTALPVMLGSTLDARKDKPGRKISARVMQEVRLPNGTSIPSGARVFGTILQVSAQGANSGSRLVVKFDQLHLRGQTLSLMTSLRAVASMTEVFEAQLPTNTFDEYGTSIADWTTVQVGGDAVYR